MDMEIAIVAAKDGNAAALVKAMNEDGGSAALINCVGCNSVLVMPGIENSGNVAFVVEWDSIDAHNAAKDSADFAEFIRIASPFFGESGDMQHFKMP